MSSPHDPPRVFPLRDYALLADGERGALVGPDGNVAWMCAPRWHDPALFSLLIGGRGGYAVTPAGRFVWGGYYEPRSLIWRSRWVTNDGIVESREALAVPGRRERAVLLRRIEVRAGHARLRVRLDPRGEFDSQELRDLRKDERGAWQGRTGELALHWLGAASADVDEDTGALCFELVLEAGDSHDLVLTIGEPSGGAVDPPELWRLTEEGWQERVPELEHTLAPRDSGVALAVLNGLTSREGGLVAAATLGLPERVREGNSFDYRYSWIRDSCYAGHGAAAVGALPLMDALLRFVRERLLEHGSDLKPAYTAQGEQVPEPARCALPGYPGGTDVTGNRVRHQFQLDAFGEIMLLVALADEHDRLEADDWRAAELAAKVVEERWTESDAGVWELDPDEWTHSRLMAVAGLRALAGQAPERATAERWEALAETILADTTRRALHPSGRWQRSPGDERMDAALLLSGLRGCVPADDERTRATLRALLDDLCEEHFVYRFRHDDRPLGEAEGAFLLCGFWAALACRQQGANENALRFFERTRSACGSPGLLAEEFDVAQRQLRGNLPQAFVHALLLECAAVLA